MSEPYFNYHPINVADIWTYVEIPARLSIVIRVAVSRITMVNCSGFSIKWDELYGLTIWPTLFFHSIVKLQIEKSNVKRTIIAIWGGPSQGKTSTIRELVDVIRQGYPNAHVNILIDRTDIKVIITIGTVIIGIESQGDPPGKRLEQSLIEFASIPCDIIVCATRTGGHTVQVVESFHPPYDIIWSTNHRSNEKNRDVLNQFSAEQILELI
jgi:hypothetical protein